jgi:hypothetical protein
MVLKSFGVLLVWPFKQVKDPRRSGDLQKANVLHVLKQLILIYISKIRWGADLGVHNIFHIIAH